MSGRAAILALGLTCTLAGAAAAQGGDDGPPRPLSAIDWLSRSVEVAPAPPPRAPAPPAQRSSGAPRTPLDGEVDVAERAAVPQVTISALDAPLPDRIGLLSPAEAGLPADLWAGSDAGSLAEVLRALPAPRLPTTRRLLTDMLSVEAAPPLGAGPAGRMFEARIDALLGLGALDPALRMLSAQAPATPELFRRWFDASLLAGDPTRACAALGARPQLSPSLPARVFCLARGGDWGAAALTVATARALGDLAPQDEALLSRFLDPDLFEGDAPLAVARRPTPLEFAMRAAIGAPMSTTELPVAFAHMDLTPRSGWKARIEAAERLARAGAVDGERLLALYTEGRPSASGGVWDRARALGALDAALTARDRPGVRAALEEARAAMEASGTLPALAQTIGPRLAALNVTGGATRDLILLSPAHASADADGLLGAVADGFVTPDMPAEGRRQVAIRDALTVLALPEQAAAMTAGGRTGEALLWAIDRIERGGLGDDAALAEGLSALRGLGYPTLARRAALDVLILAEAR
ncbi:MAG: hypothetical protein ACU0BF_12330 [Paracoccaceae bacterium]